MKHQPINSYKDFKVGEIYNREYIGPNKAYLNAGNGHSTFEIISIAENGVILADFLYDDTGFEFAEIPKSKITFSCPEKAFADYNLFRIPPPHIRSLNSTSKKKGGTS